MDVTLLGWVLIFHGTLLLTIVLTRPEDSIPEKEGECWECQRTPCVCKK